ncbi:methyltransferase, FkbM family [Rhizobiales bacterium GAS113]|nr:methyltransferase, FkbM family [Rhizobiales bacterium GAS113]
MEAARRLIRRIVGSNSAIYRAAANSINTMQIARREGLGMVRTLAELSSAGKGPPQCLEFRSLLHPILVRPGSDDIATILNNIIREEYAKFLPHWEPLQMIDAGAFIGDTSAYFLSKYPTLSVIALEPEPENLALARRNLAPYGNRIKLIPMALSGRAGVRAFVGGSVGGSLGSHGLMVEVTTVPDVLSMVQGGKLDILKMDVEGAELEIFLESPQSWLPQVDLIIAELHGPATTQTVVNILHKSGFGLRVHRSLSFFRRGW